LALKNKELVDKNKALRSTLSVAENNLKIERDEILRLRNPIEIRPIQPNIIQPIPHQPPILEPEGFPAPVHPREPLPFYPPGPFPVYSFESLPVNPREPLPVYPPPPPACLSARSLPCLFV
jgi:hypothetical protein